MKIADHVFLVTGGGSGLGAACVQRLVADGGSVIVADLRETEELRRAHLKRVRFATTDVTDEAAVAAAIDMARCEFGGLHGLINCAGIVAATKVLGKKGPHPLDGFARVIQVDLVGTFNAIRLAAEAMFENSPEASGERGVIINTASVAAFDGQIGQAAYSASKAGVAGMTLPIARELAKWGIRVMTIAPGIFATPMLQQLSEEVRQSLAQQIPFPSRLGRAEEFADLAAHIIGNEMLNGETIRLDGAIRMGPT